MGINITALMGRLTHAPELKTTPNGVSVLPFSMAVEKKYSREEVNFIDCVAWRNTAEFISKYFKKGDMIGIEGSINTRSYTDKNGNNRKVVEVAVDRVTFCGGKKENNSQAGAPQFTPPAEDFTEVDDDDLPF